MGRVPAKSLVVVKGRMRKLAITCRVWPVRTLSRHLAVLVSCVLVLLIRRAHARTGSPSRRTVRLRDGQLGAE